MAFIGTFSRALLESATAVYFGGVPVSILDAQGNVILGDDLPDAPTVTGAITDRVYTVGSGPYTVDLRTKFGGAASYTVTPANPAVSIDGYTLTIDPEAILAETIFSVRGVNGGGTSPAVTFKLKVNAPAPVLIKPFPDQSLLIGAGTVTLSLAEYFSGAANFSVAPTGQGAAITNGNLIISRSLSRDIVITVTAANATGQETADSFALLIAAPANRAPVVTSPIPAQSPTADVAFSVDLAGHFDDPDDDTLFFDYSGTLPTGITRTGAVFSGAATVSGQTANGVLRARDPGNLEVEAPISWAVSAQPALIASISPNPLVAGKVATITFGAPIDGTPSIAQGSTPITVTRIGTTDAWTFIPAMAGPLTIGAARADWQSYAETLTVQPAAAALVADSAALLRIDNITAPGTLALTAPARYAGPYEVDPADVAQGPYPLGSPVLVTASGQPVAVGQELVLDLGPWASLSSDAPAVSTGFYAGTTALTGATGRGYVIKAGDAGTTIKAQGSVGGTPFETAGIAIPAAGLPVGVTPVGLFTAPRSNALVKDIPIDLGAADPDKVIYLGVHTGANFAPTFKIVAGGVDYPLTTIRDLGGSQVGNNRLVTAWAACPAGGAAVLRITHTAAVYNNLAAFVWAAKGMVRQAEPAPALSLTAGTAVSTTLNTQVGDVVMMVASTAYAISNAAGIFASTAPVTELADARIGSTEPPQFGAWMATETAATTGRVYTVTPDVTGAGVVFKIHLRRA